MASDKEKADAPLSSDLAVMAVFGTHLSNLQHWLRAKQEDVERLTVKRNDLGEWNAVLTVWGDDGTPLVCFGNGATYWQALAGLNRSIAANRWKVDQYRVDKGL